MRMMPRARSALSPAKLPLHLPTRPILGTGHLSLYCSQNTKSASLDEKANTALPGMKSKTWAPWSEALRIMAFHPEQYQDLMLQVTKEAIVVADKFPKARKHLLVVSRRDGLDSIQDLRSLHLPHLKYMHSMGQDWVESLMTDDPSLAFRMGYHSDPSMRQLHMHIISQDFDSPSMKNKKHWNSFTTSFFRDSKDVIQELESEGRVRSHGDEHSLMEIELKCHKCGCTQATIPCLKQHIRSCRSPFSVEVLQK